MFAMQRSTRILLCRIGFVLLCVLPTTVVAGWIVSRGAGGYSAAQKAEWERELTSRLGLIVEIGEVSYPSPQVVRLHDFKLLAAETREPIGDAAFIEVEKNAESSTVAAHLLTIEANELAALGRTLEQRLLRSQTPLHIRWQPCDVTLRHGQQGQTLTQLNGSLHCAAEAGSLDLKFRLPGQVSGDPIRLHVLRTRKAPQPETAWRLETSESSLSCSLAAAIAPAFARFGKDCEFRGNVRVVQSAAESSGELSGTFERVDLDALVTEHFPHQLSGLATVAIDRALLARGKLIDVRGSVQIQHGELSPSLIAAAQEHLGLEVNTELAGNPPAAAIPFDNLALRFHLSGESLTLTEGVLVANSNGAVLTAPPNHSSTGANLLRMLLPDSEYQVPATRQTSALVRLLPLPNVAHAPRAAPAHTPTRLAPAQPQSRSAVRQPVLR